MTHIIQRTEIQASPEQVWSVLADFGNVAVWAPTVVESRCSGEAQRGMGARRVLTTTRGDVTEEVVVAWDEGHSFTFEIPDGLASIIKVVRETWCVEPSPTHTGVVATMEYQMKDGIVNAILDRMAVRRTLTNILVQNLAGLKRHIEGRTA